MKQQKGSLKLMERRERGRWRERKGQVKTNYNISSSWAYGNSECRLNGGALTTLFGKHRGGRNEAMHNPIDIS